MTGPKAYLHALLEGRGPGGRIVNAFIMGLIVLSFLAVVIETMGSVAAEHHLLLARFEVFVVGVFTVEYALRLWSCTTEPAFSRPFIGRLRFAARFLNIVDLIAILPFYLAFLGIDLRALRLFRLLRIFKLLRHFEAARILPDVIRRKHQELIVSGTLVLILLLISASLVYSFEHEAQPETFSSIPAAMWWAIATLSTVGYGDMAPVTALGRLFGGIIAVLGIGMFALPTGILAQGFAEAMAENRQRRGVSPVPRGRGDGAICPHCGRALDFDGRSEEGGR